MAASVRQRVSAGRAAAALLLAALLVVCNAPVPCRAQQHEDDDDFGAKLIDSLASAHGSEGGSEEERLESLLHWSISHSDPLKLAEAAGEADKRASVADLLAQRARVKELLDYVNAQPTETDLLKDAIAMLVNQTTPEVGQLHALKAMQVRWRWLNGFRPLKATLGRRGRCAPLSVDARRCTMEAATTECCLPPACARSLTRQYHLVQALVEPIDNANDLRALGGIAPVVLHLQSPNPELAAAAAHVLGTAASNNPTFQNHLMQVVFADAAHRACRPQRCVQLIILERTVSITSVHQC